MRNFRLTAVSAVLVTGVICCVAQVPDRPKTVDQAAEMRRRAAKFLISVQEKDGGWVSQSGPGISCLVLRALAQEPEIGARHIAVRRGVEFVLKYQHEDGGIYSSEGLLKNYESSVALSLFSVLKDDQYADAIGKLQAFLKGLQWDESEEKSIDDPWYGGAGYGRHGRPDLSNTQMMLEALRDSGLPPTDPTYKKALIFIQRCQMLGETNDLALAKGATQGGFIYTPHGTGESKAGTMEVDGRKELRCYGSMTYAGFKSMLYAGLSKDDPRVQAALGWIRSHWTLEYNPNMPERQSQEGLYYYYHVFARALDAYGAPVIEASDGKKHDWRAELVETLKSKQRPDGSWVNEEDRWMEGMPPLTTAYSMLALQAAFPENP